MSTRRTICNGQKCNLDWTDVVCALGCLSLVASGIHLARLMRVVNASGWLAVVGGDRRRVTLLMKKLSNGYQHGKFRSGMWLSPVEYSRLSTVIGDQNWLSEWWSAGGGRSRYE